MMCGTAAGEPRGRAILIRDVGGDPIATNKGKSPKSKTSSKPPAASGSSKKTAVKAAAGPRLTPSIHLPADMWERIAAKAYALFEQRGRIEGRDLQDWFDAEAIVMSELRNDRK